MHIDIVWISLSDFHSFAVYLVTISISAPLKSYSPSEYNGKFYRAPTSLSSICVPRISRIDLPLPPFPPLPKRFKPRSTQYRFSTVSTQSRGIMLMTTLSFLRSTKSWLMVWIEWFIQIWSSVTRFGGKIIITHLGPRKSLNRSRN